MTKKQLKAAARLANAGMVVVYARVSTEEQEKSGAGLDGQIAECLAYADRNGLTVVDVIREEPVSGKTRPASRPGFGRALEHLDTCVASGLLVRRIDRISRRLRHFLDTVDAADASGWSIITTDGKVDTRSASGRFAVNVMASAGEYEREVIGERTREALAAKAAAGVILGRPAKVPHAVVGRILTERANGRSLRSIAADLTADGIPTARGAPAWTGSAIQSVLASQQADVYPEILVYPEPKAEQ